MLKIYTFVTNRADFLELQLRSFENNLNEPFEFIVINNAELWNKAHFENIKAECRRLALQCVNVQYSPEMGKRFALMGGDKVLSGDRYSCMTAACGYGVCWAWENVICKQGGRILVMHHDMFLMKSTVLSDYFNIAPLAFVPQHKPGVPVHLWEGFTLADLDKLPEPDKIDWWYGRIGEELVDVGGMSHYWFQQHPEVRWMGIKPEHTEDTPDVDFHPALFEYLCFDGEPLVLHYRAASDWMKFGKEYHDKKTAWLRRQLQ